MGIDNLTHVKKGERLSAYTVNSIIDAVKGYETPGNFKPGKGIRPQTLFYTEEAIPPYSIFPLIADATDTKDTFYAKYTVEKYDKDNASSYLPGYFGTNGRLAIPANVSFFGWIITNDWDSPIKISDFVTGKEKCGFQDNSWEATVEADGLIINGSAPQTNNAYYVRLPQRSADIYILELYDDIDPAEDINGSVCVKSGQAWVLDKEQASTGNTNEILVRKHLLDEEVYNGNHLTCYKNDYYGDKIYYYGLRDVYGTIWVDRMYTPPDLEGWVEEDVTGYSPSADYTVKLARGLTWRGNETIEAGASLLNSNSTIETGTPVLCRWFVTLERWIIVEAACEPDPDYTPSTSAEE